MKTIAVETENDSDLITLHFFEDDDGVYNPELSVSMSYNNMKKMVMEGIKTVFDNSAIHITTTIKVQEPT